MDHRIEKGAATAATGPARTANRRARGAFHRIGFGVYWSMFCEL